MRRALEYASDLELPVMVHAEDLTLSHGGCMNEGPVATRLGLPGVPACAEVAMVARDLLLAEITGAHLDRLIGAFAAEPGAAIVLPTREGRRGNPVLWARAYFAEMMQLEGDAGAKRLMAAHAGEVREVDLGTDAIFADVDTPEALAQVRGGRTAPG